MRPGQAAPEFMQRRIAIAVRHVRFNEAGAGCPGIPRADRRFVRAHNVASMRPGQAAPEFAPPAGGGRAPSRCFNEAGAGCPGIPGPSGKTAGANDPLQ